MKKFLIIALVFILLPLGLRFFPVESDPAEYIREQMDFEYGPTETTEFKSSKGAVTEEYVLTTIPLMGMEMYLPKNFVDEDLMHDLRRDFRVKDTPYNKSFVELFTGAEGHYEFISRRIFDGLLLLESDSDLTKESFERGKTITLEEMYPDLSKSDLKAYTLERYDYNNGEGYFNVITNSTTISRDGISERAFRVYIQLYSSNGEYREIYFYDVKGRADSAAIYIKDSRIDTFISYALQAKIID